MKIETDDHPCITGVRITGLYAHKHRHLRYCVYASPHKTYVLAAIQVYEQAMTFRYARKYCRYDRRKQNHFV